MAVKRNPAVQHPTYQKYLPRWKLVRDCAQNLVKAKGNEYLPSLSGQTGSEYDSYRRRAFWLGATQRTLDGFTGMAFRKPPIISTAGETKKELEIEKDSFLARITPKRKPFVSLARMTVRELLQTARVALLLDLPDDADSSIDPWVAVYQAESLISWEYGSDDKGEPVLIQAVLEEIVEERKAPPDDDEIILVTQWKVLMLEDNEYKVQVWRKGEGPRANPYVVHKETITPQIRGKRFTRIPLVILDMMDDNGDLTPPFEPIAEANVSHFLSSADLEHGRHYTALPTPYVCGIQQSDKELKIGSMSAWMISDAQAKVGMLEFTGQGLGSLEKALEAKENLMAVLGARLLEAQKKGVEAADTHQMRGSGEQSVLASVVLLAQQGLNEVLTIAQPYVAGMQSAVAELNLDFAALTLTSAELDSLVKALQSGAISEETFFYNMQQAEMYPPDRTFEDEQAARQQDSDKGLENEIKRIKAMPETDLGNAA